MNHRDPEVHGYPVNYDGESPETIVRSFSHLVADMTVQIGIQMDSRDVVVVSKSITQFVQAFFNEASLKTCEFQVKELADLCKQRRDDLAAVCNMIASDLSPTLGKDLFVLSRGSDPKICIATEVQYIPREIVSVLNYSTEYDVLVDDITLAVRPRFYIYLYKMLFALTKYASSIPREIREDPDSKALIRSLLLLPVSLSQIYEKMNPATEVMMEYGENVLNLLTCPSKSPSKEFWELFDMVSDDLRRPGRPPLYVSDFRRSLERNRHKMESPFERSDYYATLKAGTSKLNGKRYPTFVGSLFEVDSLSGREAVHNFDSAISYTSCYRDTEIEGYEDLVIKTIMIPNPSKYKPRAIHIAQNAIQDRCKYLHRRLKPFLDGLATDCMSNQRAGVDFLKRVTSPSYRLMMRNSIFASDFSNATDTLSQEFQEACLDLVFPPHISRFWGEISKLDKVFVMPNGEQRVYKQSTGQPQGLLGSFDCFSLGHHVLMLMLMKGLGLENVRSSDFYRILGDDSVVSSPVGEQAYELHSRLCEEVSLIKNDAKSTKSFIDDVDGYDRVLIDFAKVSVFEGEFCSPLPVGLGMSYCKDPKQTKPSVVLWYDYHGLTFKRWMSYLINDLYGKDAESLLALCSILYSGEIPYLRNFSDQGMIDCLDSAIKGASIFAYGVSEIKRTLFGYFVSSDKEKAMLSKFDSFDKAWNDLIPTDLISELMSEVPANHKYVELAFDAIGLAEDLTTLYELGDPELAEAIESLVSVATSINSLSEIVDRLNILHSDSGDSESNVPLFLGLEYEDLFSGNKDLEGLQRRSLREKMTNQAGLLRSASYEFKDLFRLNCWIQERIEESKALVQLRLEEMIQGTKSVLVM